VWHHHHQKTNAFWSPRPRQMPSVIAPKQSAKANLSSCRARRTCPLADEESISFKSSEIHSEPGNFNTKRKDRRPPLNMCNVNLIFVKFGNSTLHSRNLASINRRACFYYHHALRRPSARGQIKSQTDGDGLLSQDEMQAIARDESFFLKRSSSNTHGTIEPIPGPHAHLFIHHTADY